MTSTDPWRATEAAEAPVDLTAPPTFVLRAAGGVVGMAGAITVVAGVQLHAFFFLTSIQSAVGWAQIAGGVLLVACALWALRESPAGCLAAAGLAGVGAVGQAGWTLYALFNGVVSPLMLLAPVGCLLAAVIAAAAAPEAQRRAVARAKLMAELEAG